MSSFVSAVSEEELVSLARKSWQGTDPTTLTRLQTYGETPSGLSLAEKGVFHVDGKHSVVVFRDASNWYPGSDTWVFPDKLVTLADIMKSGMPGGWRFHLVYRTFSCDEKYDMCMGASSYCTASLSTAAVPAGGYAGALGGKPSPDGVPMVRRDSAWHYDKDEDNYDRLSTDEGFGDAVTEEAIKAELCALLTHGDASQIPDLYKGECWAGVSKALDQQQKWLRLAAQQEADAAKAAKKAEGAAAEDN